MPRREDLTAQTRHSIARGDLYLAVTSALELPGPSPGRGLPLDDAAALTELYGRCGSARFDRARARLVARLVLEHPDMGLHELGALAAAVSEADGLADRVRDVLARPRRSAAGERDAGGLTSRSR
jgi:hypothetical protein